MIRHKWIHDKSAVRGIPDIEQVEEFFMRRGFRTEPKNILRHGKPFGPSGYVLFRQNGTIILVTPTIEKGVVGEAKFW